MSTAELSLLRIKGGGGRWDQVSGLTVCLRPAWRQSLPQFPHLGNEGTPCPHEVFVSNLQRVRRAQLGPVCTRGVWRGLPPAAPAPPQENAVLATPVRPEQGPAGACPRARKPPAGAVGGSGRCPERSRHRTHTRLHRRLGSLPARTWLLVCSSARWHLPSPVSTHWLSAHSRK